MVEDAGKPRPSDRGAVIKLVDVYTEIAEFRVATKFLYRLLEERDPIANISHRAMPTFEEHTNFVDSHPYKAWYVLYTISDPDFVLDTSEPIGAVYLTHQNEIGIFILKSHQGQHYAKMAIRLLMQMHPADHYLANIAPGNVRSISLFEKLGFDLIQLILMKESK